MASHSISASALLQKGAYSFAIAIPLIAGTAEAKPSDQKSKSSQSTSESSEVRWESVKGRKTSDELIDWDLILYQDFKTVKNPVEKDIPKEIARDVSGDSKKSKAPSSEILKGEDSSSPISASKDSFDEVETRNLVLEKKEINTNLSEEDSQKDKFIAPINNYLISEDGANSKDETAPPLVLISEVVIEGLEAHPDKERLKVAAYDAMTIRPGSKVSRDEVKVNLDAIYSTGWFSGVKIEPINGPLGVQLVVQVQPNPVLVNVEFEPKDIKLLEAVKNNVFSRDFGKTLNFNVLQLRMKELKNWYVNQGYSLARISGPNRVTAEGIVQLRVVEGTVNAIEIDFINKEGETEDIKGNKVRGKTRRWVIEREISMKPGAVFNRKTLESDLKRLYGTSLFSDIKVQLKPVSGEPGKVNISLGITEQQTGSLTGGVGYSGSQGFFGQIGLQETNLIGRSWSSNLNLTYGQYGGLVNFSFTDPWIKGDKHRTSFRTSAFIARELPQAFRSQEGGSIRGATDYYHSTITSTAYDIAYAVNGSGPFSSTALASASVPNKSWFDYEGDAIALEKTGGGFSFARPLNGGDPYKRVPWTLVAGMNFQKVKPIDYSGYSRPYGVATTNYTNNSVPNDEVICIAFNCAKENTLVSVRGGATYNKLNDSRNPTSGDFFKIGTEQFFSLGMNSPTFNRTRISYSYFIPVNWLRISKGCRPKSGEKYDCPQALGFQVKTGGIIGELPPYEAFCLGGSNSVRGWSSCDLGVAKSFGEFTAEYRFPVWRMVSGLFFFDAGTDFGTQKDVPGKPGKILKKPGDGYSLGTGAIVNTPVGPLRLEAASQEFSGDWRYNIGVGWKF